MYRLTCVQYMTWSPFESLSVRRREKKIIINDIYHHARVDNVHEKIYLYVYRRAHTLQAVDYCLLLGCNLLTTIPYYTHTKEATSEAIN